MTKIPKEDPILDDQAKELYEQFEGIDQYEEGNATSTRTELFSDPLGEEQELMDSWHMALVELVYKLAQYMFKIKFHGRQSIEQGEIEQVISAVSKIHAMSERPEKILIRYRGMLLPDEDMDFERIDYVVSCGGYSIDLPTIKALAKRKGIAMAVFPEKLKAAFDRFPSLGINSICFISGKWHSNEMDLMRRSLKAAAPYFDIYRNQDNARDNTPRKKDPSVIYNDGVPDPNLTLLAGVNALKPETIQSLLDQLRKLMEEPDSRAKLERFVSDYDALFAFKKIRERFQKPLIEINNLSRLVVDSRDGSFSPEKSQLVRMIAGKYGHSHEKLAQAVDSVYGDDFATVNPENLELRLDRASDLLDSLNEGRQNLVMENEVMENLETRLSQVQDDVFEALSTNRRESSAGNRGSGSIRHKLTRRIEDLFGFFKRRAITKKKIKDMVSKTINFNLQDYETIARDFNISVEEAKRLLELLKGCFDDSGSFLRNSFEKSIPEMAKYGENIFGFLWHYLKETPNRKDRVAFLNSLQSLIFHMKKSPAALRFLLTDFCIVPGVVRFSDRNALIMVNVLLRKHNIELYNDIEITPEEVLLVREELNPEAVKEAGDLITSEKDAFFEKLRSIHREMLNTLHRDSGEKSMPLKFLLSLERECFLIMALIHRTPGHTVLRSAVNTYGDPESEIYQREKEKGFKEACLKHLRVAVRGLSRYKNESDLMLLNQIRAMEPSFKALKKGVYFRDSVEKTMQGIDSAIETISGRNTRG